MLVADSHRRRLLGLVGAVAATALALTGCSAGQDAQTVEQTSVVDGTAFEAGQVNLRDVGLRAPAGASYAAGQNAYLEGLVVNNAPDADTLVSISTPVASSVVFYPDGVSALLGTAEDSSSAGASPSASASATESTTTGASGTPSATSTPTQGGTPTQTSAEPSDTTSATGSAEPSATGSSSAAGPSTLSEIPLPTNQAVQFGYGNDQPAIVLLGLTEALFPAQAFAITFTFANGGSVTATIAVKLPVGGSLDAPTIDTHQEEGGAEGGE